MNQLFSNVYICWDYNFLKQRTDFNLKDINENGYKLETNLKVDKIIQAEVLIAYDDEFKVKFQVNARKLQQVI